MSIPSIRPTPCSCSKFTRTPSSVICREIDDVISADLDALQVRPVVGGDRTEGWQGFGKELTSSIPQAPYKPLELELAQLFLELAGEVRRVGD